MAIQMTRSEYEAKYGIAPIFGAGNSFIDTTPAKPQMSRSEYIIRYGKDPFTGKEHDTRSLFGKTISPAKESIQGLGTLFGGTEHGIARKLVEDVKEGAKDIQEGMEIGGLKGVPSVLKGFVKAGGRVAGDIASTIFAPIGAVIGATGFNIFAEKFGEAYVERFGEDLTNNPTFQKFAIEHPNAGEDFDRALMLALSGMERGKIEPKTVVSRTKAQLKTVTDIPQAIVNRKRVDRLQKDIELEVNEIGNIENQYVKLRNANQYSKDSGASSRRRIAQSGVLDSRTVDTTGTIRTKQVGGAVERYRKLTLDGAEDIIRQTLKKEGKTINLREVATALARELKEGSKLEGADLRAALTGATREIKGLQLRADPLGNIPLYKIHDAKINTTKNINFQTPPETATYRKTVARVYKNIVERKSSEPIMEVNKDLGKYLSDIKRLENLDGRKVKGGKLGKYSARIAGNLAGGAAGGAVGGFGGVALGTLIGGEIAAILKGKALARTFRDSKGVIPKSKALETAKAKAKLPVERNLNQPDPILGVPKDIPKTEEVLKLERSIRENVKQQKEAIKDKNFTLVKKLKEVYDVLVEKLKAVVRKIKDTPNKEGGFIRNPAKSDTKGVSDKLQSQELKKSSLKNKIKTKGIQDKVVDIDPIMNLKREVVIRDVAGNKHTLPQGEALTPYILKDNKILIKNGKEILIPKSVYENLKGQSVRAVSKEFAPELKKTEETVRGGRDLESEIDALLRDEVGEGMSRAEARDFILQDAESIVATKFEQYTLPEGKNYKEVLIKAPAGDTTSGSMESLTNRRNTFKSSHWDEPNVISHLRINEHTYKGKKVTFMEELQSDWAREVREKGSAFEGNPKDFLPEGARIVSNGDTFQVVDRFGNRMPNKLGEGMAYGGSEKVAIGKAIGEPKLLGDYSGVPNNPNLKNWQELTIKRGLIEAVETNADYFAWINGKQTSARYNLATYLDDVKWTPQTKGRKLVTLNTKQYGRTTMAINEKGVVIPYNKSEAIRLVRDMEGKKLDEVLGKGLADSIMAKESGTLSGEGLKFGGEWAENLYDRQVGNIVKDLTGAKVEVLDMGLPIEKGTTWYNGTNEFARSVLEPSDLKVGATVNKGGTGSDNGYIITDVLGDGKFKAVKKSAYKDGFIEKALRGESLTDLQAIKKASETFDISQKTTIQQGIEITPEVKAIVRGEVPSLKKPSGLKPSMLVIPALPLLILFLNQE